MIKDINKQIERVKAAGATYVDARWYPIEEANYLMMWNGNLKSTTSARESGMACAFFTRAPGVFQPLPT
jgi:TldD protein